MQSIIFYAAAHEALGVCRDYANAQTVRLPSIVRGSQVTFRLRLFATAENPVPYPMSELEKIVAWKFVMDNDFDEATTCKLEAQNDQIAVSSVTENIDGTDFEFTEIAIPMLSLNTSELIAYMGSSETVTLNSELVGKDADGNDAFILQLKGYSIRNRIAGAGDPTPLPSGFGEAEVRALIAAGFDVQSEVVSNGVKVRLRAKNSTGAWGDPILIPSGNTPEIRNGYWYLNGTNTGVLAEAKSASPNAVGKLAERPAAPSDGFCYLDSENSDFYWYIGGRWTAAVHLTSVEGPQGVQGEQGIPGAVWLPSVDADGLLTYKQVAHDSEEIPHERNIRGPQGKTGAQGPQGIQGKEGKQGPVGPAGDGLAIDMADTMANRYKYDSAPMGFRFLATDWMADEDGRRYQYWYMKKSDAQGDWSGAAVLYCGKTGAQGPQGEIGPRGFQGARGENAAVVPDVEFIGAKDEEHPETPFVFGGSITVKGTKPVAQVELYNEAGLGVSIERGDSIGTTNCMIVTDYKNSETTVYFGTDLDLSHGGRIRFAQGIGGETQYQIYIRNGGTLTYDEWYQAAIVNPVPEAPKDGHFYCRKDGAWVAVNVTAIGDVTVSGTRSYTRTGSVGSMFSLTFDAVASDGSAVAITLKSGTVPNGLSLSGKTLSGTPTAEGSATLVFAASSGAASMDITVSLTIQKAAVMYYGYVAATNSMYKVTSLTAAALSASTVKSAAAETKDKTSLGDAPAGSLIFVLIPKTANLKAVKFDGISGWCEFEENRGADGTGTNGAEVTISGTVYRVYGEATLVDSETFIKVETI